jgi:aminoglycoside phosphotransferase (APT) family kinase protein
MDGRAGITADLVRRLVVDQAPQWADLAITPVEHDGNDNRTYRLGDELTVRLPTHRRYAAAVAKEDTWLPVIAAQVPLPVPEPVFSGRPSEVFGLPWSVRRWLPGAPASRASLGDNVRFAGDVARFLRALWAVDPAGGPPAGEHSFYRGSSPEYYDDETRRQVGVLAGRVDGPAALAIWNEALRSRWAPDPVWFHGDVASGNLLVQDGRLAAVIDFGTSGVGDPASDLQIAWTFFSGPGRRAFAEAVDLDPGTWARARGWTLWKALISVTDDEAASVEPLRVLAEVLADPIVA